MQTQSIDATNTIIAITKHYSQETSNHHTLTNKPHQHGDKSTKQIIQQYNQQTNNCKLNQIQQTQVVS